MDVIALTVPRAYRYTVHFTTGIFSAGNPLLCEVIAGAGPGPSRLLVVVDRGVQRGHPDLVPAVEAYCHAHRDALDPVCPPLVIEGGEQAKNTMEYVTALQEIIADAGLGRDSYVLVAGGGALLDAVGYAAACAHGGVRVLRVPTTVQAQAEAGLALTSALNGSGRKDYLRVAAPPFAVVVDSAFLASLSDRDWRSGLAEAVKVALVRDQAFFETLEAEAPRLATRDGQVMQDVVRRCAELHLAHLLDGPGAGSAEPDRLLDFGHWAAHKLEQLSDWRLRHGEAVAAGLALDVTYAFLGGRVAGEDWTRVMTTLAGLGFPLWVPELDSRLDEPEHPLSLLAGLEEFRQRHGGRLTIPVLQGLGEAGEGGPDLDMMRESVALLRRAAARRWRVVPPAA